MKEERQHKYKLLTVFTLAFLLTGTILAYHEPLATTVASPVSQSAQNPVPPQPVVTRTVRVAIYLETNTTCPSYATPPTISDFTTGVQEVLQAAGCQVTNLTLADILNHALLTASYDVFVMIDNMPRENITNLVKEFWLGGGGILSLDSAISYICYAGMLPPESEGSDGFSVYWNYSPESAQQNVTTRHPVTKALHVNDTVTTPSVWWAAFDWTVLQTTSVANEVFQLGTKTGHPNDASMVAFDPVQKGGRVVQLPCNGTGISSNMQKIIVDAMNWLCPHPKARIVYDLSHRPQLGVDGWDTLAVVHEYYSQMRNSFVNRSYTFDKLYPEAAGNFTAGRLASYDLLIVVSPNFNITAAERTAVIDWVQAGGGVLALGDRPQGSYVNSDQRINFLLDSLNLRINMTAGTSSSHEISYSRMHPTLESCGDLYFAAHGYLNVTGSAYSLWNYTATSNIVVAGQTYGQGRVILASDMNFLTNDYIVQSENLQYGVNLANWLTAAKADVLIYVDTHYPSVKDPNWNVYRGSLAQALNDLSIPFYLTFSGEYFNMSLTGSTWTLAIFDNIYFSTSIYMPDILNYMKAGGHLILSSWSYASADGANLYHYLGFNFIKSVSVTLPSIHVWNPAHDVFTKPNHYGADNISYNTGLTWTFGANVTVFSNATAIAGLGQAASTVNASIILGAGGRAVTNAISLSHYASDTDDSTYPDNFEIWENEIAYMMRPQCTLTPIVAATVNQGTVLSVSVNASSLGLSSAMEGSVTLSVPAGLGTLLTSATQSMGSPLDPETNSTLTWQVNTTGIGPYTLSFAASYKGYKNTSYTATSTAGITAIGVFVVTPVFSPGATLTKGTQLIANLTVKDANGTALTDATITADLNGTAVTFTHLSAGVYRATISTSALNPGSYLLNVSMSKSGFTSFVHSYAITVQAQEGLSTTMIIIIIIIAVVAVVIVATLLMMRKRGGSRKKR